MGFLSSVVNYKNLELLAPEKAPKPQHQPKDRYSINKAATINPEINLLGNTVDEAIARLEKYLDDAMIAGLTSVRVVHGKEPALYEKESTNISVNSNLSNPINSQNSAKEMPG